MLHPTLTIPAASLLTMIVAHTGRVSVIRGAVSVSASDNYLT